MDSAIMFWEIINDGDGFDQLRTLGSFALIEDVRGCLPT